MEEDGIIEIRDSVQILRCILQRNKVWITSIQKEYSFQRLYLFIYSYEWCHFHKLPHLNCKTSQYKYSFLFYCLRTATKTNVYSGYKLQKIETTDALCYRLHSRMDTNSGSQQKLPTTKISKCSNSCNFEKPIPYTFHKHYKSHYSTSSYSFTHLHQ